MIIIITAVKITQQHRKHPCLVPPRKGNARTSELNTGSCLCSTNHSTLAGCLLSLIAWIFTEHPLCSGH